MGWQVKAGLAGLACLALAGCVDPGPYGPGYAGEPVGYVGGYGGGYVGGGGPVIIDRGPSAVIVQDRYRPNYYNRGYDRGYDNRSYDRGYDRGYNRGERVEQRREQERRFERREERREVRQAPPPQAYNPMAAVQERDRRAQEQLYRSQP